MHIRLGLVCHRYTHPDCSSHLHGVIIAKWVSKTFSVWLLGSGRTLTSLSDDCIIDSGANRLMDEVCRRCSLNWTGPADASQLEGDL